MKALLKDDLLIKGFGYPLSEYGFDIAVWGGKKSEFDIFDEEKPNIVICNTHDCTPSFIKCLNENKHTITILFNKDAHKHSLHPLEWKFYVIPERKKNLPTDGINLGEWKEIILPPMVDTTLFYPVKKDPILECDLGVWGPQNDIVYSMCYPIGELNIKIFGPDPWSQPQYMGMTSHENRLKLYRSAKACWAHSVDEALRIMACKGFSILTPQWGWDFLGYPPIQNAEQLKQELKTIIANEQNYRTSTINKLFDMVIQGFTYQIGWEKILKEIS